MKQSRFSQRTKRCAFRHGFLEVKRETGVNPVRSRHCKQGAGEQIDPLGNREGSSFAWICKSGNLPAVGTGMKIPDHE